MSGHLDRRLKVIARRLPPPRKPPARDGLSFLTVEELETAEAIAARYGPLPRRSDGTVDLSGVSDADVETMADLAERVKGRRCGGEASPFDSGRVMVTVVSGVRPFEPGTARN